MKIGLIFLFILYNVLSTWSSPHFVHVMDRKDVFCGSKLTNALALVCRGNYNRPSKKSMNDLTFYNDYEDFPNDNDDNNQLDFPFLLEDSAKSFIPARFRRRKGIVDECCKKSCSYRHLSLYCA